MSENRKSIFLWILVGGGIFLILAGLVGVFLSQQSAPQATPTPASAGQVQRVTLLDAKEAFDAGTAVFLDVRDGGSFADAHIPGALSIPITDLPNRISELDPSTWIIPYCT
jgi:3-mercaptopyruvate sulfurtransferase SseA